MKRYLLIEFDPDEMPDKTCPEGLVSVVYHAGVRTADATPFELAFSVADDDTILFQAKQMFERLS